MRKQPQLASSEISLGRVEEVEVEVVVVGVRDAPCLPEAGGRQCTR